MTNDTNYCLGYYNSFDELPKKDRKKGQWALVENKMKIQDNIEIDVVETYIWTGRKYCLCDIHNKNTGDRIFIGEVD